MNTLHKVLATTALSILSLGCGTESNEPPLVPEIVSIEIHNASTPLSIYALDEQLFLYADILYTDGTSSSTVNEVNWFAKDAGKASSDIFVHNGEVQAVRNHGDATISITYRNDLQSTTPQHVTIKPLTQITNFTQNDLNITLNTSVELNVTTGYSIQMAANGEFNDSKAIVGISSNIIWSSSNTSVATIQSTTGLINVLTSGSTEINASVFSEVNASVELNITVE